jgi:hypothetical protein
MNKYQTVPVHEIPHIVADILTKEAGAGRARLQGQPGYISGVCLKNFLNLEPVARTCNSS